MKRENKLQSLLSRGIRFLATQKANKQESKKILRNIERI